MLTLARMLKAALPFQMPVSALFPTSMVCPFSAGYGGVLKHLPSVAGTCHSPRNDLGCV